MKTKTAGQPFLLLLGDIIVLTASLGLTLFIRYAEFPTALTFKNHLVPFSFIFLIWILVYFIYDLYSQQTTIFQRQLDSVLSQAHLVNSIIALAFFYFIPYFSITPKTNLFLFLLVSFILIGSWRRYLAFWVIRGNEEHIFFACQGQAVDELIEEISTNNLYQIRLLTIDDLEIKPFKKSPLIVINTHHSDSSSLEGFYNMLFSGARFVTLEDLYETIFGRVPIEHISERWFLESISTQLKVAYGWLKRMMDFVIAAILGLLSLVLYPVVWVLIKLDDDGQIFSVQERLGQNNQPISLYKFRTMTIANDRGAWGTEGNKVTRVGVWLRRLRIDELPQLWNVVRGDLSLIGPRPEFEPAVRQYAEEIKYYNVRHLVKPGLSGWAQIYGDHSHHGIGINETKNKLSYDLYYIKNRSLLLDLKIALKTIRILLSRSGV